MLCQSSFQAFFPRENLSGLPFLSAIFRNEDCGQLKITLCDRKHTNRNRRTQVFKCSGLSPGATCGSPFPGWLSSLPSQAPNFRRKESSWGRCSQTPPGGPARKAMPGFVPPVYLGQPSSTSARRNSTFGLRHLGERHGVSSSCASFGCGGNEKVKPLICILISTSRTQTLTFG